jgi:NAD(P)-dependent dehydrogenase (short-subunit alcohol dehydrogenase family)
MSRVFITGSTDGLGLMAARLLVGDGHQVTLHARNDRRAADTRRLLPQAEAVVVGDLSSAAETRWIAEQVNALGRFDAVIHSAGVGYQAAGVTLRRLERFWIRAADLVQRPQQLAPVSSPPAQPLVA